MIQLTAQQGDYYPWRHPWIWLVPLVALLELFMIVVMDANRALFLAINGSHAPGGESLWLHLTVLGDALMILSLPLLFVGRHPRLVWALVAAAILTTLFVHVLKGALGWPRPLSVLGEELVHVIGPALHKRSFPSGHTAAVFSFAAVLCLTPRLPIALKCTVLALALVTGFSRIMVGAHWPQDILAGAAGGWLVAALGSKLAQHWQWGLKPVAQRGFALFFLLAAIWVFVRRDPLHAQTLWMQYTISSICIAAALPALRKLFFPESTRLK